MGNHDRRPKFQLQVSTKRRIPRVGQLGRNTLNAYAAGLLDGEGCVRWNQSPTIEITNKHYGVLIRMADKWGGSIRLKSEDVFVWTLYSKKAIKFLNDVTPYTIIKYQQIVALLKAIKCPYKKDRLHHLRNLSRLKHVYTN